MAPRVLLLSILFTVGLLTGRSIEAAGLELSLGFARQPQDAVALRSKPLLLPCAALNTLPGSVNISWTHNRRPLVLDDPRRLQLANGSLYFKKVLYKRAGPHDSSDEGEYRCLIRNSVGALLSRPAQLTVAVLPHDFDKFPVNTTAEEGDVVRFMCQIKSVPRALIAWERNGNLLPQTSRSIILDSIDQDSGELYLTDVQKEDEGTYRCVATNVLTKKSRTSPEGLLTVSPRLQPPSPAHFQPNILPTSLHVMQGESLSLPCAARGEGSQLSWTFTAVGSNKSQTAANRTAGNLNVLQLKNLTLAQAGNYSCVLTAPGVDSVIQWVRVDVWVPPSIKESPASEVYPTAKTVRFKCEAVGVPKPKIIWYKDGVEMVINGRIKQKALELVMLNAVTSDSGLYQCVASSKAGEIWAAGRLYINASRFQQDPPHNLSCQTISASQVQLDWEIADSKLTDSKIVAYSVHYFLTSEFVVGGGNELQTVSANRTVLCEKLIPFTNYTFYVRAYGRSASDPSPRIICQTGEGVPQGIPTISLEATSPTTVRVTWSPLSSKVARGVITEYKIQWRRFGHPSSNVEEVKGDVLEYTVTGLHPGKKYEVRVLAATKKGWPDLSEEQLVWTTLDMPSYGPQNIPLAPVVNLSVVNSSSIEVSWSMPAENKLVPLGYKLFYRKQTSQLEGPIELPANASHYVLGDLEPHTWYEVHVVSLSSTGEALGVQSTHTLPLAGEPGLLQPPSNLEASPTSPTSISLSWTPSPSASEVSVSHYNVSYGPVARGPNGALSYARGQGTGVEISNLRPYTLYEFKVRTHDHNNRHGPYSQKLECHTMEDVPSAVEDVQWKSLNSSSIRVTWKEPAHTNGVVVKYVVSVRKDVGRNQDQWQQVAVVGTRYSAEVTNLSPKTRYILLVQASTHAGLGTPSGQLSFSTPASPDGAQTEPPAAQEPDSDHHLGIMVGVAIGGACVVACVIALVWRRHCTRRGTAGPARHANGNGYCQDWEQERTQELQQLELATHIPPANHTLLDTKGHYPNGHANGLKHPLLSNGRIPNGPTTRDRSSVHITENPQYKCGESPTEPPQPRKHVENDGDLQADHQVPLLSDTLDCSVVSSLTTELEISLDATTPQQQLQD